MVVYELSILINIMIVKKHTILIFTCALPWIYDCKYNFNHNIVENKVSIKIDTIVSILSILMF